MTQTTIPIPDDPDPDDPGPDNAGPYAIPAAPPQEGPGSAGSFFETPISTELVVPSAQELERVRNAHVRSRLADIHADTHKKVTAAIERLGSAGADVQAATARFALAQHHLRVAANENGQVLALAPARGGVTSDPHNRPVGRSVMIITLLVCAIGDYLVDRGSLLVFRLPLAFTETLALLTAVVQTISAHTAGRLLRRLSEAIDRAELWQERRKLRLLVGLISLIAVALAVVRAARGNLLLAALVLGVAGASAVVAVSLSYLHANSRLDALERTGRTVTKTGNKAADHGSDKIKAQAKQTAARNGLMAAAADVVARIDLVYVNHGVDPGEEPAWVAQLRDWAAGRALPFEDAG